MRQSKKNELEKRKSAKINLWILRILEHSNGPIVPRVPNRIEVFFGLFLFLHCDSSFFYNLISFFFSAAVCWNPFLPHILSTFTLGTCPTSSRRSVKIHAELWRCTHLILRWIPAVSLKHICYQRKANKTEERKLNWDVERLGCWQKDWRCEKFIQSVNTWVACSSNSNHMEAPHFSLLSLLHHHCSWSCFFSFPAPSRTHHGWLLVWGPLTATPRLSGLCCTQTSLTSGFSPQKAETGHSKWALMSLLALCLAHERHVALWGMEAIPGTC